MRIVPTMHLRSGKKSTILWQHWAPGDWGLGSIGSGSGMGMEEAVGGVLELVVHLHGVISMIFMIFLRFGYTSKKYVASYIYI